MQQSDQASLFIIFHGHIYNRHFYVQSRVTKNLKKAQLKKERVPLKEHNLSVCKYSTVLSRRELSCIGTFSTTWITNFCLGFCTHFNIQLLIPSDLLISGETQMNIRCSWEILLPPRIEPVTLRLHYPMISLLS